MKKWRREQIRGLYGLSGGELNITRLGVIELLYNSGMGRETAAWNSYHLMLI